MFTCHLSSPRVSSIIFFFFILNAIKTEIWNELLHNKTVSTKMKRFLFPLGGDFLFQEMTVASRGIQWMVLTKVIRQKRTVNQKWLKSGFTMGHGVEAWWNRVDYWTSLDFSRKLVEAAALAGQSDRVNQLQYSGNYYQETQTDNKRYVSYCPTNRIRLRFYMVGDATPCISLIFY